MDHSCSAILEVFNVCLSWTFIWPVLFLVGPPTQRPSISGPCGVDEATCASGECIPRDYLCDGENDCTDKSDETNCSKLFPFDNVISPIMYFPLEIWFGVCRTFIPWTSMERKDPNVKSLFNSLNEEGELMDCIKSVTVLCSSHC